MFNKKESGVITTTDSKEIKKYINTLLRACIVLYLSMYLCYLNKFPSLNYTHKIMFSFITNNYR